MLAGLALTGVLALICAGVALDAMLGEPRCLHPLVGFGRLADLIEARLNSASSRGALKGRLLGALALAVVVGVPVFAVASAVMYAPAWATALIHASALYFALGAKSLWEHIHLVAGALAAADLEGARALGARIVTRDLREASETDVARAAVESALENGNDAVFGALFWFAIGGAPGVIAYRLVNTLDAMWGYKTQRYLHFGWAAARLDDALNYAPARLTALTYALLGNTRVGLACWQRQAHAWESPNAGPVMAAGAGALGLTLGGTARYHGHVEQRPLLGVGDPPKVTDIDRALRLVLGGVTSWLGLLALLVILVRWSAHA
jgi:adenosylcobinamide-phosphate synthase